MTGQTGLRFSGSSASHSVQSAANEWICPFQPFVEPRTSTERQPSSPPHAGKAWVGTSK